jgi:mono/diheme cytochrome c family protein
MDKFNKLAILALVVALVSTVLITQRSGFTQGQQNSTTNSTNRGFGGLKADSKKPPPTEDLSKATWNIPADADKTKNPVEATPESIAKGKELYYARAGNCVFCHGETGSGNEENMPRLRRKPADLSAQTRMSKISDGEIFWKMTLGIPGIMPGREKQLTEEDRWHVVNYVRTLAHEKPAN